MRSKDEILKITDADNVAGRGKLEFLYLEDYS